MSREYRFEKVYLDKENEVTIIKALSELPVDAVERLRQKEIDGTITSEDFQVEYDKMVAGSVGESIEDELNQLKEMLGKRESVGDVVDSMPVKKIVLDENLFAQPSSLTKQPIQLSGKGKGSIFNRKVQDTANELAMTTETANTSSLTRIEKYKDEMIERLTSVRTMEEYSDFAKWYTWYLEEDKQNLSPRGKISSFILVVLLEIQVFKNYGIDIEELNSLVTADTFPIETIEEYSDQVLNIANYTSAYIKEHIGNYSSDEMTLAEFAEKRGENFSTMFDAVM